jgi:DNA-binding LytR/AlgR family response regulator
MNSLKVLIVEDEILIAEHIKDHLLQFGVQEISMAHNKNTAIALLASEKPNLVLLDMHLQQPLDGLDLAKLIDTELKLTYIFITANSDMLVIKEAVQTNAAAYITKPIKQSDLFAAIQLSLKSVSSSTEKHLLIKDGYSVQKIIIDDIQYVESNGNYLNIVTKQQKHLCRQSMDWLQAQLPEAQFMRIHRSYFVNLNLVQKANTKFVYLNNLELPISRTYLPKVQEYLKIS